MVNSLPICLARLGVELVINTKVALRRFVEVVEEMISCITHV